MVGKPSRVSIYVTTTFAGMHHWPAAPPQVMFLRNLHRHQFGVRVGLTVTHSDRQLEFFMVQAHVNTILQTKLLPTLRQEPAMSCEMMATFLGRAMIADGYPVSNVEVNEDNENGAIVHF